MKMDLRRSILCMLKTIMKCFTLSKCLHIVITLYNLLFQHCLSQINIGFPFMLTQLCTSVAFQISGFYFCTKTLVAIKYKLGLRINFLTGWSSVKGKFILQKLCIKLYFERYEWDVDNNFALKFLYKKTLV